MATVKVPFTDFLGEVVERLKKLDYDDQQIADQSALIEQLFKEKYTVAAAARKVSEAIPIPEKPLPDNKGNDEKLSERNKELWQQQNAGGIKEHMEISTEDVDKMPDNIIQSVEKFFDKDEPNSIIKHEAQEVEITDEQPNGLGIQVVDLEGGSVPDLDEAEVAPVDLTIEYWTPEKMGEQRRAYFSHIQVDQMQDLKDNDVVVGLPTAYFISKSGKDGVKMWRNASKQIITTLENNKVSRGTPLEITYNGKEKNKTNNYKRDDWTIRPLKVPVKKLVNGNGK